MKSTFDTAEMNTVASQLKTLSEQYTEVSNQLMNIARTMGDAWNSADNLAFVQQIEGLVDDLKAMSSHLMTSSETLNLQRSNYEAVRDSNITNVKQLQN